MSTSFNCVRNSVLCFVLSACVSINAVYADSEENKKPTNSTVDSILGALADMTVDEAKKILNLQFTRDIREKVCGFYPYTTNYVERDTKGKNINILFSETCKFVKDKVERNIFSEQLIDAFKKDMVLNGILLVGHAENLTTLIAKREEITRVADKYQKELLASKFVYLTWREMPIAEAVQQALSESDKYRRYVSYVDKALAVAKEIKKIDNTIENSISLAIKNGDLVLVYERFSPATNILDSYEVKIAQSVGDFEIETVSILFRIANATDEDSQRKYTRDMLVILLNGAGCMKDCVESINRLIKEKPSDLFVALADILELAAGNKSGDDVDRRNLSNYKAIGTLKSLSELSNVQDKAAARAILDKYLADENTRTARYWDQTYTLGTLLGVATGGVYCDECTEKHRYIVPNLYMPFGLFYTYGRGGVQLHIFDLGQYTSINKGVNDEESTNFKDAIAPGLAIFGRLRRYPASFGIDYTYIPGRNNKAFSEHQLKVFFAMDIQLFKLN